MSSSGENDTIIAAVQAKFDTISHEDRRSSLDDFPEAGDVSRPVLEVFVNDVCQLLLNYLSGVPGFDVWTTAEGIELAIPGESTEPDEGLSVAYDLWSVIIDAIYQIPHDHELQAKLATLVFTFTQLSEDDVQCYLSDNTDEWQSIRDLPALVSYMSEVWNGRWPGMGQTNEQQEYTGDRLVQWESWLRFNAFAARIYGHDIEQTGHIRSIRYHAMITLQLTILEHSSDFPEQTRRDIMICSAWIQHSGQKLYAMTQEDPIDKLTMEFQTGGPMYQGPPGLCVQRWNFWKKRLMEIADSDLSLPDVTRQLAREVAANMSRFESLA